MEARATTLASAMMVVLVLWPICSHAQSLEESFLTDYSRLKASADNPFDEMYMALDAPKRAAQYKAVMVDQPELFIHPASKIRWVVAKKE